MLVAPEQSILLGQVDVAAASEVVRRVIPAVTVTAGPGGPGSTAGPSGTVTFLFTDIEGSTVL